MSQYQFAGKQLARQVECRDTGNTMWRYRSSIVINRFLWGKRCITSQKETIRYKVDSIKVTSWFSSLFLCHSYLLMWNSNFYTHNYRRNFLLRTQSFCTGYLFYGKDSFFQVFLFEFYKGHVNRIGHQTPKKKVISLCTWASLSRVIRFI